jgi:hypothetical protein
LADALRQFFSRELTQLFGLFSQWHCIITRIEPDGSRRL